MAMTTEQNVGPIRWILDTFAKTCAFCVGHDEQDGGKFFTQFTLSFGDVKKLAAQLADSVSTAGGDKPPVKTENVEQNLDDVVI